MSNPFKDFWEASNLSTRNVAQYAKRMSSYDADNKSLKLQYPLQPVKMKRRRSKLSKLTQKRSSTRSFADEHLRQTQVDSLLRQLSTLNGDLEHRTYPSAGASYSVETFYFDMSLREIFYYDPEHHAKHKLATINFTNDELNKLLNVQFIGQPSIIVFFVGFPDRVTTKYGERGNRFMLLEAGAMLQQISLGITESKDACGCAVGGLLDEEILKILKLEDDNALLLSGYIVGKKV